MTRYLVTSTPEQKRRISSRLTEKIRPISVSLKLAKKRHENDRTLVLSEQLSDALKREEARAAHRLSRLLAGRGLGAR